MADTKANLLIAAAALVIPLTVSHLETPSLRLPALVMIVFSVVTIALATFSVMPQFWRRPPPPTSPGFNPLFHGHFARLSYAEFLRYMDPVLQDTSQTYEIQLREIYLHGRHLERHKYRFLSLAYVSLISGVGLSALVWVATQLWSTI